MGFWNKFGKVLKVIGKVATGPAGQAAVGMFVKNPNSKKIAGEIGGVVGALEDATDAPPAKALDTTTLVPAGSGAKQSSGPTTLLV